MGMLHDIDRKRMLAPHLYYIMVTAGLTVKDVTYTIEEGHECYTVTMKNDAKYRINVSADSPITAVYEVINKMRFK